MTRPVLSCLMAITLAAGGCGRPAQPKTPPGSPRPYFSSQRVRVAVSISPQAYFVERVGGSRVIVTVMVPSDQSPETFEPSPTDVAALEAAHLYVRIGMPFEDGLLKQLAHRGRALRVVDLRQGIQLRRMEGHHHDAAHAGHAEHGVEDPHIWLDPNLVKHQAKTIRDGLVLVDPSGTHDYDRNLRAFWSDLAQVDAEIRQLLAPVRGKTMLVFHPAFGYFADAYGLRQVPIEMEGKEPSPRQLVQIADQVRKSGTRVLFSQTQFRALAVEALAGEIGVRVVPLDPLSKDYLNNLRSMAERIAWALGAPLPTEEGDRHGK